jgi:exodeoxyribonuclease-1
MRFIFYDTETTGTDTSFDQILQFAAIHTDAELNELERFEIHCRLLPYIVPAPGALLVTGATVADITTCPTSHFEMMRQVHAKMHQWSQRGAVFIGWNSMRFDETLLRQAYYQTLLPVYQTNTNGNGRADMMRMAQVVSACAPNTLAIPVQEDGKRTFKLGLIAAANNVALEHAHDALADTSAVLDVAKLIRQRTPALWDALMTNARKSGPLELIQRGTVLLLSYNFFNKSFNFMVTAITKNSTNPNEWAVFDLQFDPARYLDASDEILRAAIEGNTKAIRRVSINSQPGLLPIDFAPADVQGGRQSLETYQIRANAIKGHSTFQERIARLLADRYKEQAKSDYIEEQIYSGFPSDDDQARMHSFHEQDWDDRVGIIQEIEDKRSREFGRRIIATERPDLLSAKQRKRWESWCRDRLCTDGDTPWLTVSRALEDLAELTENASLDQQRQLVDLRLFLKSLGN